MARLVSIEEIFSQKCELRDYCPVSLYLGKVVLGQPHISLCYQGKYYRFASVKNMRVFFKNPYIFSKVKTPEKLRIHLKKEALKESRSKGNLESLIHNELSRLVIRCMNQISLARIKYPTLTEQSTALKLMALCLKSSNPQRSKEYREKYKMQMKSFISDCLLPKQIQEETARRKSEKGEGEGQANINWTEADESHFVKLTQEFSALMNKMKSELTSHDYFNKFIR